MSLPKSSRPSYRQQLVGQNRDSAHDAIAFWVDANAGRLAEALCPPLAPINVAEAEEYLRRFHPWLISQIDKTRRQTNDTGRDPWAADRRTHSAAHLQTLQTLLGRFSVSQPPPETSWALPLHEPPTVGAGEVKAVEWEWPLSDSRGSLVGFVDISVKVERQQALLVWRDALDYEDEPSESWLPRWDVVREDQRVNFEIKPRIDSVADVIRQVQVYRKHRTSGQVGKRRSGAAGLSDIFVVVSPDTRYAELLKKQGIQFIEAPSPKGDPHQREAARQLSLSEPAVHQPPYPKGWICKAPGCNALGWDWDEAAAAWRCHGCGKPFPVGVAESR
jgi:hypothetical protein